MLKTGQEGIAQVLKENYPEYLSAAKVSELTGVGIKSVSRCLKELSNRNEECQYIIKKGSQKRSGLKKYYRMKEEQ